MTGELLALASCRSSAAAVLTAVDRQQTELLDLLIQLRHTEVRGGTQAWQQLHIGAQWGGGPV